MCYWMMEKRSGAAKKSTESELTTSGKTEKVAPAESAIAARRQSEEKAYAGFKGRFEHAIVKDREEETLS